MFQKDISLLGLFVWILLSSPSFGSSVEEKDTSYRKQQIHYSPFFPIGKIKKVHVQKGQLIEKGDPVITILWLKSEIISPSTHSGLVSNFSLQKGQLIFPMDILATIMINNPDLEQRKIKPASPEDKRPKQTTKDTQENLSDDSLHPPQATLNKDYTCDHSRCGQEKMSEQPQRTGTVSEFLTNHNLGEAWVYTHPQSTREIEALPKEAPFPVSHQSPLQNFLSPPISSAIKAINEIKRLEINRRLKEIKHPHISLKNPPKKIKKIEYLKIFNSLNEYIYPRKLKDSPLMIAINDQFTRTNENLESLRKQRPFSTFTIKPVTTESIGKNYSEIYNALFVLFILLLSTGLAVGIQGQTSKNTHDEMAPLTDAPEQIPLILIFPRFPAQVYRHW